MSQVFARNAITTRDNGYGNRKSAGLVDQAIPDYAEFLEVLKAPELAKPNVSVGNVFAYVR